ncbi:response regulator [Candidatus Laterigemmans baculatus]|uniref:response regulator n=1 Tax=Candidatus Laterigemmans baculatus TaxID=2770505 RepID=UPI0013DCF2D2|nr:response regulator [Candidatus Laterigemmans baculatus]
MTEFGPHLCRFLEHLSTAAYACDSQGRITDCNPQAVELWQRQPRLHDAEQRFCGSVSLFDASGSPLPHDQSCVARALRENREVVGEEVVIGRPDGSRLEVRIHVQPQADPTGKLAGAIVVFQDVTAERRAEEQLKKAARTEAVGKLIGGLSHEFNNLLTVIGGCAEFALLSTEREDPNYEALVEISGAIEKASLLTNQLLAVCKKQIIQPRVVKIDELVERATPLMRRIVGEGVEVQGALGATDCFVKVDPGQLEQILLTLAVHAQKATPDGGVLRIETARTNFAPSGSPSGSGRPAEVKAGEFAMISVYQSGSESLLGPLDPPSTLASPVDRYTTGADLGLDVLHDFVRKSGGFTTLTHDAESGSTLSLYLPVLDHPAAPPLLEPGAADQLGGVETVLVVEDDPAVNAIICRTLAKHGYQVLQAGDGVEALHQVESDSSIRVVISDVVMPQMSGHKLAAKLAASNPAIKVMFISGYSQDAVFCQIVGEHNVAFLQKPFSPGELARSVRTLLDSEGASSRPHAAAS